jgi:hypothetical protein
MAKSEKKEKDKGKEIDCKGVRYKKCPGNLKKLCKTLHCYFKKWNAWAKTVQKILKDLDVLYDAIIALQDHVYDEKTPDLTKRLKRGTPIPETGDPPDPPFGDEE